MKTFYIKKLKTIFFFLANTPNIRGKFYSDEKKIWLYKSEIKQNQDQIIWLVSIQFTVKGTFYFIQENYSECKRIYRSL